MYKERGNASSASIGGVFERGRVLGGREGVVGVAFGPGVTVEMCLVRRTGWRGREVEEKGLEVEVVRVEEGEFEGENVVQVPTCSTCKGINRRLVCQSRGVGCARCSLQSKI